MGKYTEKSDAQKSKPSEIKGQKFERYIQSLFPKNFVIEKWTTDIIDKTKGVFVEANLEPDFTIRNEPTKERFAIECKYRSNFGIFPKTKEDTIEWSNESQLKRYKDFEKKENIPVFIMIGVGGEPNKPNFLFCIPLDEIKYSTVFERIFSKYQRVVDKELFFKNNLIL